MTLHSRRLPFAKREERLGDAGDLSWLIEVLNGDHDPQPAPPVVLRISQLLSQLRQVEEIRAELKPYAKESNGPTGLALGRMCSFDDPYLATLNLQGGKILRDETEPLHVIDGLQP